MLLLLLLIILRQLEYHSHYANEYITFYWGFELELTILERLERSQKCLLLQFIYLFFFWTCTLQAKFTLEDIAKLDHFGFSKIEFVKWNLMFKHNCLTGVGIILADCYSYDGRENIDPFLTRTVIGDT